MPQLTVVLSIRFLDMQARLEPKAQAGVLEARRAQRCKTYWLPLPLVARLTQLVSLRLRDWRYVEEDVSKFHLLAALTRLQVRTRLNNRLLKCVMHLYQ